MSDLQELIAISVGNTRTRIGRFLDGDLDAHAVYPTKELAPVVEHLAPWISTDRDGTEALIAMASVNATVSDTLSSAIRDQFTCPIYRIGSDIPVPVGEQLDPETITGIDRLLNAAAAFDLVRSACIVIDAGTAITVDFVDEEGTFHGGAIAPGALLQLTALHEGTDALPEVEFSNPGKNPFGRSTGQAMLRGVYHGIRGLTGRLIDCYSEKYGSYPSVIATGGDAAILFEDDALIDRIVPHLTLSGIEIAARSALASRQPGEEA